MQEVADAVFYERDSSVKTKDKLKYRLQELYDCRNVIAHQAGRRHSDAQRENISKEMVENYIEDIERIVKKIQELAQKKDKLSFNKPTPKHVFECNSKSGH